MLTDTAPGATLRTARLRRGLGLDEAAASVRVSVHELKLLENDDYEGLPSRLHARAYLRRYAEVLGLDPQPLLLGMGSLTVAPQEDPDETTDPYGFPARLRPALRFDEPFLRQRRSRRRRGGRHLAPPPITYVAYPEPAWIRPVRRVGRPRRSRLAPPLLVMTITAAATIVLYLVFAPAGDAAEVSAPPVVAAVQVLDGSGDPARLAEAVGALRAHGYEVLATETLADPYFLSVVLAPQAFEDEAEALVAADPRFGVVRPARDLETAADLYVVVGRDWPHPR